MWAKIKRLSLLRGMLCQTREVDLYNRGISILPGQYLLTGSANIQSLPSVQESLAGRITKIRLRPLTQGEIVGAKPTFIDCAFEGTTESTYTPLNRIFMHWKRFILLSVSIPGFVQTMSVLANNQKYI